MQIQSLQLALIVMKSGSIAEAARQLNLDPSSVSRTIAALEADLKFRLFHRTTRQLSVTEEGGHYLRSIEPLLEELERTRDEAHMLQHAPSGTLHLTASVAFGSQCIIPHLGGFRRKWPDLKLDLQLTDSNLDLAGERIDLAFRLSSAITGDWISRKLVKTRYVVCASKQWATHHQITQPSDLVEVECVRLALPDFMENWRFFDNRDQETIVPVTGPITVSNPIALKQAALAGLGPTLLATWMIREELEAGTLIDVLPNYRVTATTLDTGLYALYPSRKYLPAKTRVTIDYFAKKFRETIAEI